MTEFDNFRQAWLDEHHMVDLLTDEAKTQFLHDWSAHVDERHEWLDDAGSDGAPGM